MCRRPWRFSQCIDRVEVLQSNLVEWWQKGSPDKHKIVSREMADEHPDAETGDAILVLSEQEQSVFKRNYASPLLEHNANLSSK